MFEKIPCSSTKITGWGLTRMPCPLSATGRRLLIGVGEARAAFLAGHYREVSNAYERNATRGGPNYIEQWVVHAAAYGLLGESEKAHPLVSELLKERPDLTLGKVAEIRRSFTPAKLAKLREGLRNVGFPD